MKITLAQIAPKLNRTNIEDISTIIQDHIGKTDLIVFPELALNGYLLQDKLLEDAWHLNELVTLMNLSNSLDIVVGAAIYDAGVIKNSALYFSKGQLLSKHDKVHLPNYGMFEEARYFQSGNIFESFHSCFGVTSMLVCEDMWHSSVHRELMKRNPDLIVVIAASPARGFVDNELKIQTKWMEILKTVSTECNAQVVFVNRVGFEDGLGFWGGSCILSNEGKTTHQLSKFEHNIETFTI